jgi:long-subunit fatty acid transport protein
MKRVLTSILALALLPGVLFGQSFSSSAKGTTAADFLELGVGGRAMGLGGAYTAVADDASALYWNPAGLTSVEKRDATFMHAQYLQSSFYDYAAYAQNLGKYGAFAAGFQYLNAGAITETDSNFNSIGTYTPYDLAVSAGYAYKFDGLGPLLDGGALGLSVKYIRAVVLTSAQTAAMDFGVMSPEYLDRKLRLAAVVLNLGGTLKYEQMAENLPLTFKVGGAYHITNRWLASVDVAAPRDNGPYFAAGTEYQFIRTGEWSFAGRIGYNSQTMSDVTGVTGMSVGAGFGLHGISIDYAFVPYGGLGITNRISVSAKF